MKAKIQFVSNFVSSGKNVALLHVVYIGFINPYLDGKNFQMISNNTALHYYNTLAEAKKAFTKKAFDNFFIKANITLY